jgi:hypothetical protein
MVDWRCFHGATTRLRRSSYKSTGSARSLLSIVQVDYPALRLSANRTSTICRSVQGPAQRQAGANITNLLNVTFIFKDSWVSVAVRYRIRAASGVLRKGSMLSTSSHQSPVSAVFVHAPEDTKVGYRLVTTGVSSIKHVRNASESYGYDAWRTSKCR